VGFPNIYMGQVNHIWYISFWYQLLLEFLLPTGKTFDQININYKKMLKQILSLYTNVADPAIYILSGLLSIEAITLFGNITRSDRSTSSCRWIKWKLYLILSCEFYHIPGKITWTRHLKCLTSTIIYFNVWCKQYINMTRWFKF
jgi:hypothetical protein